ncbi:DUF2061 domain-containing protein [Chromohalobacter israelensis]|uniref:Uncharacterized conserved membrane protein n=2 Tax=Chromohalobacter TaxID=42054 RepID=Q1QV68_CHRI1|nr:DUF2061 domain-containing protein [Chromohalobacter salexigens]ABE59640.1 uncharacterized conserved membrane protein [Chromohalobacter salexigens DSM 3043]MDO0947021.1 DUF2061 domain-containing protein [Chromohalobacter salexigens]NWO57124.1 DUF2061 domain-containing protein [Chromohalobacter salexigens]PWW41937.1 putative membrane protein DUF2061 [Chromohalobacter salexigens]RXE48683.1 hypothetical protein B4O83_12170 [Chromohalobacter salexigens]
MMNKALSVGVIHFPLVFAITWILTADPVLAGLLALVEPLVTLFAYHLHGRLQREAPRTHCPGPQSCMRMRQSH